MLQNILFVASDCEDWIAAFEFFLESLQEKCKKVTANSVFRRSCGSFLAKILSWVFGLFNVITYSCGFLKQEEKINHSVMKFFTKCFFCWFIVGQGRDLRCFI